MAFENLSNNAKELYANVQELVKSQIEYYRLDFLKKSAKGTIALIKFLVLGSVFFFLLFFLSFATAIWIGEELGRLSTGFFIVTGFYVILFILAYIFCKTALEKMVINKFSKIFYPEKEEKL